MGLKSALIAQYKQVIWFVDIAEMLCIIMIHDLGYVLTAVHVIVSLQQKKTSWASYTNLI